jgi:hypothetical protein
LSVAEVVAAAVVKQMGCSTLVEVVAAAVAEQLGSMARCFFIQWAMFADAPLMCGAATLTNFAQSGGFLGSQLFEFFFAS